MDGEISVKQEDMTFYAQGIIDGLSSLREEGILCDITLIAEKQKFQCHKVVLCALSSFFRSMFTIDMKECLQTEVDLKVITAASLQKVLDFMYNGGVDLHTDDIYEILQSAAYLQVTSLLSLCDRALAKDISKATVLDLWTLSTESYPQLNLLRKTCETFMLENFVTYFKEQEFLEKLQPSQVVFLASHHDICSGEELFTVQAFITKWFDHDFENRKVYLLQVFENVRLLTLDEDYIYNKFPYRNEPILKPLMEEADIFFNNPGQQIHFKSPRAQHRTYDFNKKSLIIMGKFDNFYSNPSIDLWGYDMPIEGEDHGEWTRLQNVPVPLGEGFQTCVYGLSSLLVLGGKHTNSFLEYDGKQNAWHIRHELPHSIHRWSHCMAVVGTFVYLLGGYVTNETSVNTVCRYDYGPKSEGVWHNHGFLLDAVTNAVSSASTSQIFVLGNEKVQCYDTSTQSCTYIMSSLELCPFGSQIFADGNADDLCVVNGSSLWHLTKFEECFNQDSINRLPAFSDVNYQSIVGIVKDHTVLYIIGTFHDNYGKSKMAKGVMTFDLVQKSVTEGMEKFQKHPFLPSDGCTSKCHNLIVRKKTQTTREINHYVKLHNF